MYDRFMFDEFNLFFSEIRWDIFQFLRAEFAFRSLSDGEDAGLFRCCFLLHINPVPTNMDFLL